MGTYQKRIEQMALSHLLSVAWDEFDKSLLSAGARFVLWGSFSREEELVARYLSAKGMSRLIDGRRTDKSRTSQENNLVNIVNAAASDVSTYVNWAKNRGGGQPILREALVGYCVAFEACLKNAAVAFTLAKACPNGLEGVAFIPDGDFKKALKLVKEGWRGSERDGQFRAKNFFEEFLVKRNPTPDRFPFHLHLTPDAWSDCWAAFDLRNSIVHQMGRVHEQVTLAETVFDSYREIELKLKHLSTVADAMREILAPLDPYYLLPL